MDRPLILVGMMGAGKTTIGRMLAQELALPLRDADVELEDQYGESIPDMFTLHGEAVFRQREAVWVNQLSSMPAVIATGGGMPCFHNLMELLLALGWVVYLKTDSSCIEQRMKETERPLWGGVASWKQLLAERSSVYQQAHLTVDTTDQSIEEVALFVKNWYQSR